MAQGTSSYVSFSGSNGYSVRIYFDQVYNESTSVSTVSVTKLGIKSSSYSGYSTYVDGIIKINGTEVCTLWNNHGVTNLSSSEWYYMTIEGSTTVSHGSDGSASISISVHSNQFGNFYLRSSGGATKHGGVASGKSQTATLTPVPVFTLTLNAGAGSAISVTRTYSPAGSTKTLSNGDRLWKDDLLKIVFNPATNYKIVTSTVNNAAFASGNTHTVNSNVYVSSTAQPLASDISATDANIGSTTTIVITRYDSSYTHTITYSFGGETGTIATKTSGTTISWSIPTSFYSQIPNASYGKCTLTCETYSGSTLLGTSTCQFIATAHEDSCKPSLTATVVDGDSNTIALTGNSSVLIRYKSDAVCTANATSINGASLTSVTINGLSVAAGSSYTYTDCSSAKFEFKAIDSRGYASSVTLNPTVVPYIRLTINPVIERPDPTTGEIVMTFNGNYYNGSFGKTKNTLVVRYRYREATAPSFGSWSTVSSSSYAIGTSTYYTSSPVSLGTSYDYQKAYVFEVQAYDGASGIKLDTVSATCPVQKGEPVFDWGEDDFSFHVLVEMNGRRMTGLGDPSEGSDAVTKNYVDTIASEKATMNTQAFLLSATLWSGTQQTVDVSGVTATNIIIPAPAPEYHNAYYDANIRCVAQTDGQLTFACDNVPESAISVNVLILS